MKPFDPGVGLLLTAGSFFRHAQATDVPSSAPTLTPVVQIQTVKDIWIQGILQATNKISEFAVFNEDLPIVGKSINELVDQGDGTGISSYFSGTLTSVIDSIPENLSTEHLQTALNGELDLPVDPCGLNAPQGFLVTGDDENVEISISFCIGFSETLEITSNGMFDSLEESLDIKAGVSLDVGSYLKFSATLNTEDETFHLDPITAALSLDTLASITVGLGMLDLSSEAQVVLAASYEIIHCPEGTCSGQGDLLQTDENDITPLFYLNRIASYEISGDIELAADSLLPGFEFDGVGLPSFNIGEPLFFDPDSIPTFEFTGFEWGDFSSFSPLNAVNLLKIIDSAIVRVQENEGFTTVNIPLLKKPFSEVLATGSIVTKKLNKLFVKVEDFDSRVTKTLVRQGNASHVFDTSAPVITAKLELILIRNELTVNTEDFSGIQDLADADGNTKCSFTLSSATIGDGQTLVDEIKSALLVCSIAVCDDCPQDNTTGDFQDCDCELVVALDADGIPFIATTAYTDAANTIPNDILLLTLLEQDNPTNEEDYFGFKANSPATPASVPRFRHWQDLANGVNTAIQESLGIPELTVIFAYIAGSAMTPSQIELDITFEYAPDAFHASLDTSIEIGNFANISLTDESVIDIAPTITVGTGFAVILGPNDEERIVIQANSKCNFTFDSPCDNLGTFEFSLAYNEVVNGLVTIYEAEDQTLTGIGTDPVEALWNHAKLRSILSSVDEVGDKVLVLKFLPTISKVEIISDGRVCKYKDNTTTYPAGKKCIQGDSIVNYTNVYGIRDVSLKKLPFQLMVGETSFNATVEVDGKVEVAANIGGVIEATAGITADFTGSLVLVVNPKDKFGYVSFSKWLRDITGIATANRTEFFFNASAIFDGNIHGVASAGAPFSGLTKEFDGTMDTLFIDFLKLNVPTGSTPNIPRFNVTVDLPTIGNVKDLSFSDVVDILSLALDFLVGEDGGDVKSCSGGLLGTEINNEKVFQFQIPGEPSCILKPLIQSSWFSVACISSSFCCFCFHIKSLVLALAAPLPFCRPLSPQSIL
jgi:hypothetical protein